MSSKKLVSGLIYLLVIPLVCFGGIMFFRERFYSFVTAALAILTGNIALAHTPELEERMIHASTYIGLVDGTTGTLEAKVDGMPADVHKGIVELMYNTVERALKKKK